MSEETTRFNFNLNIDVKTELEAIAKETSRTGAADILRQLASEYVRWYRHGGSNPVWVPKELGRA